MELEPATSEERARMEKQRMMQEAYFEKHGEQKEIKQPSPAEVENPVSIDAESLKKIEADEIAEMQIYRLEWIDLKPVKRYCSIEFGKESRQEIEGVMKLVKEAPKWKPSMLDLNTPDRTLVVRLKDGAVYEIRYNSHLSQPFAGLDSRKLKEALCGLSCNSNKIAILKIIDLLNLGYKTVEVTHMVAQPVQKSGVSSNGIVTVALELTEEGDLVLDLKIKDSLRTQILVDSEKKIQFGGAAIYDGKKVSNDIREMFVAYLLEPSER